MTITERYEDQLLRERNEAEAELATVKAERDALQRFKDWTHSRLDALGVPHHPPGVHGAEGCRIGDRMDWLESQLTAAEKLEAIKSRTFRIEHSPNCPSQFLVRFPGKDGCIRGNEQDVKGYGSTLTEAIDAALATEQERETARGE